MSSALITGAAGGIGGAIARRLFADGYSLVLIDVPGRAAALESLARELDPTGERVLVRFADVRRQSELDAAVAEAMERFGDIGVVCANAGVWRPGAIHELADDEWQLQLDVNLTGVYRTLRAVIPRLREQRAGSIIITSSIAGLRGGGGGVGYIATKHALGGVLTAAAHELGPFGVRVNAVNPTAVDTDLVFGDGRRQRLLDAGGHDSADGLFREWADSRLLPIGWIEPADVANAVGFLASDDARTITGVQLPVDAGHGIRWGNTATTQTTQQKGTT